MILTLKKQYVVDIDKTRRILNKKGFRFAQCKNDPQQYSVILTAKGRHMYKTDIDALLNIEIFIRHIRAKKARKVMIVKSISGKI